MAGERYVVELDFRRVGDLGLAAIDPKLRAAERRVENFRKGFDTLGRSVAPFASAIDGVARTTASFAAHAGVIGGAALFAGATYGVVNLNNELEKAQISLGTIFSAQGMAKDVPTGIERAKILISQMRVDAQKLPGEFEDLMRIFTTGAIPAFHSGATIDQFRELSSKAMAAGKVASMDLHQVAREFAMLLEGRSGAHNVFGMKLLGLSGDSAKEFNQKAAGERFNIISKELDKYSGSIDAFGNSFDAQSSTLIDNLKNMGRQGTASLFISVKDAMKEANDWFTKNQESAILFATRWGDRFNNAFNTGKRLLQEWGPILLHAGETAYQRFTSVWIDVQPWVQKFGDSVQKALEDPNGTIDKLIELAKLWAALRIGGAAVGGFQAGGMRGAMGSAGAALGMYGVSHAALSGATPGTQVETMGGGALMGFGAGGPLGAGLGALGGATIGLWQMMSQSADAEERFRSETAAKAEKFMVDMRRWYATQGLTTQEASMAMDNWAFTMQERAREAGDATGLMVGALYASAASLESANAALFNRVEKRDTEIGSFWGGMMATTALNNQAARELAAGSGAQSSPDANKHKAKGGGGGSVQKVEIVVTSNQHPSRIARAVVGELGKVSRMAGSSPHVENFSALDQVD